ncbi:MAG: ABC transporter permease, partial [Promethearchaeota archaeon]
RTIGKTILMNNQTLSIVGILKPKNFVVDHFIVCDFSLIQKAFEMDSRCTMIYIFGEQDFMQNVDKLTQFKKNLEAKYSTIDVIDKSELELAAGNYFKFLDVINYVLEIFPLIVSLLFVYVLMVLNVKDQEREFGMLRAIGMPSSKLSIIIFSQSLFIGLMGYLTSFLFRMLDFIYFFYGFKANILNENLLWNFVNRMSNNIPIRVNWQILIASLVIGVVISVYPLYRATRQNIVVSFRKDE